MPVAHDGAGPPLFGDGHACACPLMPFAGTRCVSPGGFLLSAGDPATHAYMIRRGQVRVFLLSACGRETTTAVLGPGQMVGVSALVGRPVHHAFVEALTAVEVWTLPIDRLVEHLAREPGLLVVVGAALARRLALTEALVADVTLLPVRERVRDALDRLGPCLGGERPRLTREILSKLVGARRETVSRAVAPARRPAVPARRPAA